MTTTIRNRARIARYRTEAGAARYAADLLRVWGASLAEARPSLLPCWSYGVKVRTNEGREAFAAPRPRNFGRGL